MSEPVQPEVAAWGLVSKKGWVSIDQDLLTRLTWVPCPPFFPDGENRESWAAESAALWWRASGLKHGKRETRGLAEVLSAIHKDLYAAGHCHQAVIHLPDPRMLPLPVQLGVWQMEGGREEQLRTLANAGAPEAIEPPVVEEFTTDRLGTGLKALHYRRGADRSAIHGYLSYAWRSEEYETDLRLFTFCWDLSRLQRAIPDIDELARAIAIVPRSW
jgi:hypothetical protein